MSEHTPGPWKYVRDGDYWSIEPTGIGGKDNYEGTEADYRLAAAAPDLLTALKYLVAESPDDLDDDYNPHAAPLALARAAIAKASP